MTREDRTIDRAFGRGVVNALLARGCSRVLDAVAGRWVADPGSKTFGQVFSEIYRALESGRRNEYFYLNTLLNRANADGKPAAAFSQMWVGGRIADFVLIGEEGVAYEIKSDLDGCARLADQLRGYRRAFGKTAVLTNAKSRGRVERVLDGLGETGAAAGVLILAEDGTAAWADGREPGRLDKFLEHDALFKLMRKAEYSGVIERKFGGLPRVGPVFLFAACLEMFGTLPIKEAQELAFKELGARRKTPRTVLDGVQRELSATIYFSSELSRKLPALEKVLRSPYRPAEA
jgi:hypothetical protein